MTSKSKAKPRLSGRMLPIMHPDAAGIDIGAEEIFVAVPPDRSVDSIHSLEICSHWPIGCASATSGP